MADLILISGAAYAAIGVAFGIAFSLRGVGRVDPAALHSPWTFQLLIFPGVVALWPLLAWRWLRVARAERSR